MNAAQTLVQSWFTDGDTILIDSWFPFRPRGTPPRRRFGKYRALMLAIPDPARLPLYMHSSARRRAQETSCV